MYNLSSVRSLFHLCIFAISLMPPLAIGQSSIDITRMASEDCTVFFAWTGELGIDKSGNATEQWLAQDEIQASVGIFRKAVDRYLELNPMEPAEFNELLTKLPWLMMKHPFAIQVGNITLGADPSSDPPLVEFAMVVELGKEASWAQTMLDKLNQKLADEADEGQKIESVSINNKKLTKLISFEDQPELLYGIVDGRLMVGFGDGSMNQLIKSLASPHADWLEQLKKDAQAERVAGLFHLDMKKVWPLLGPLEADIPEFLHLSDFHSISYVMDLKKEASVATTIVRCPEQPEGLLSILDVSPLKVTDVNEIPTGVTSANAIHLSIDKTWQLIKKISDQFDLKEIEQFVQNVEEDTGPPTKYVLYGGLPPGPIANPGRASLMAA
ncbi:MAG: hypothetical protein AAGA30_09550, partial [Planctomycetota bacterium]